MYFNSRKNMDIRKICHEILKYDKAINMFSNKNVPIFKQRSRNKTELLIINIQYISKTCNFGNRLYPI